MRARRFHHRVALMHGCFWLPCPLCGHEFGCHEWKSRRGLSASITTRRFPNGSAQRGRAICPDCTGAGLGDPAWAPAKVGV